MRMKGIVVVVGLLGLASPVWAQDHALCSITPPTSFTVGSGAPFAITWLMPDTATENGITVPNRWDGFYVQIDGGPKNDIGKATALPACSAGSPRPGDIPFTYTTPSGVNRGNHTLRISAWSFTLDANGNPTTTRQEGAVSTIPFVGGNPILFGVPQGPGTLVIIQDK